LYPCCVLCKYVVKEKLARPWVAVGNPSAVKEIQSKCLKINDTENQRHENQRHENQNKCLKINDNKCLKINDGFNGSIRLVIPEGPGDLSQSSFAL